jgi:hypothetical protein
MCDATEANPQPKSATQDCECVEAISVKFQWRFPTLHDTGTSVYIIRWSKCHSFERQPHTLVMCHGNTRKVEVGALIYIYVARTRVCVYETGTSASVSVSG